MAFLWRDLASHMRAIVTFSVAACARRGRAPKGFSYRGRWKGVLGSVPEAL